MNIVLTQAWRKVFLLFGGIIIGILLSAGTVYYLPNLWPRVISLPVAANHPGVSVPQIDYGFTGKITKIDTLTDGRTVIHLDLADGTLPTFYVTSETLIFQQGENKKLAAAKVGDLKVGSTVNLDMVYNLSTKVWKLSVVIISS